MNKLTLSMIVKNEEKYLEGCLQSVTGIVDEIVIVDTGSADRTIEVAKKFGASVFHFKWVNDFSAARNFALSKSNGDWILYLDADERLMPESRNELLDIIKSSGRSGYNCIVKSLDSENGRDNQMTYVRLFKNSGEIRFKGSVHEQILPSLLDCDYRILDSSILIEHIGYNICLEGKRDKALRNLELLLKEYESVQTPYTAFQLALTFEILDNYSEAKKYFEIAAGSTSFSAIYRAHAYTSLALFSHKEHNSAAAENFLKLSFELRPEDPFSNLLGSKISIRKNDWKKALDYCRNAERFNQLLLKGSGNKEYSVYLNPEEIVLCGLVIARSTNSTELLKQYYRKLIEFVNSQSPNKPNPVSTVLNKIFNDSELNSFESQILVDYASQRNLFLILQLLRFYNSSGSKGKILEKLNDIFPSNVEIMKVLAEFYQSVNLIAKASCIYIELSAQQVDDPSIYFYLLSYHISEGNYDDFLNIMELIERKYGNIPEVADRINQIRSRLVNIPD
ncbi:MAG TPA: glycosyltransferase family 2 protein [Melioribacteraceae bacterium]|nr:glycosyltransferase family 2 protein [Melioribacteraceae bacterium]